MNSKLQAELYKKYPKIFRQKDLTMNQTSMCWGISTGDGWFRLIDTLCGLLQFDTDHNDYPQIEATQVKEKFGSLRFYYTPRDVKKHKVFVWKGWEFLFKRHAYSIRDFSWTGKIGLGCFTLSLVDVESRERYASIASKVRVIEYLSGQTCEQCGAIEGVTQTKGWIVTLCPRCLKKYNEKRTRNKKKIEDVIKDVSAKK